MPSSAAKVGIRYAAQVEFVGRGRHKLGGLGRAESMSSWPEGPGTISDLFAWQSRSLSRLGSGADGPLRMERLRAVCAGNVFVASYYTGKGTDGTVFEHLNILMEKENLATKGHKVFVMESASDCDKACLKLLAAMRNQDGMPLYRNVFGDMESKFTAEHKQSLEILAPAPKPGADQELRTLAYEEMSSFLKSEDNVYKVDEHGRVVDYCFLRKGICIAPGMARDNSSADRAAKRAKNGGLRCVVAGSCCEDFARYSAKLGPSGPKMKAWVMFKRDMETIKPDMIIFENADTCPESFYVDQLGHLFQFMSVVMSPVVVGWPARRPRRYTFGWDANRFQFLGSPEDFLETFAARPVLDGDVFFQASKQERQSFLQKLAQRRSLHYPEKAELELDDILSVAESSRYASLTEAMPQKCSLEGVCLADLDQNVGYTPAGPYVPTLVKHFKIVNLKTSELMLPVEALAVQGEPVFDAAGNDDFPSFMWPAAESLKLSDAVICKMAGNSFHIGNFGPFVLYCFSCLKELGEDPPSSPSSEASSASRTTLSW